MKKAIIILTLVIILISSPVSAKGLPEEFVSFYDTCREQVNTCGKALSDKINLILTWRSDTSYIVSFGNNNPENISGVYGVEVKLRSDFENVEIIALGEDVITPIKAENGMVTFDYNKEIVAGGYGKAFITLNEGEVMETPPPTTPPPTTSVPLTTQPPNTPTPTTTAPALTTKPPITPQPTVTLPPETTVQPATTVPTETEEEAEEPIWKPLQGLIITIVLSIIITIALIKSRVLEPPE